MKYIFNKNQNINSKFIKEDYFPTIIEFANDETNCHFIEFSFKDSEMFELSIDSITGELKRFCLTLCNNFVIRKETISIPSYEEGSLIIEDPEQIECDEFFTEVFDNGLLIRIRKENSKKYIKCGQLIIGLTSSDDIAEIYVVDLTPDEILHLKSELSHK